jgi:HSP20 family protein
MALVPLYRRHRGDLARLHSEMDDLFSAFFGNWPTYEHKLWPAIDVADNEDAIVIKAELPGCKADDINISVHGNTLTISGEKKQEQEQKEKGYYHLERSYGSFRRDLNLSNDVDTTKVNAACKDGVLTITLPKAEKAKAVKVKVKEQ